MAQGLLSLPEAAGPFRMPLFVFWGLNSVGSGLTTGLPGVGLGAPEGSELLDSFLINVFPVTYPKHEDIIP